MSSDNYSQNSFASEVKYEQDNDALIKELQKQNQELKEENERITSKLQKKTNLLEIIEIRMVKQNQYIETQKQSLKSNGIQSPAEPNLSKQLQVLNNHLAPIVENKTVNRSYSTRMPDIQLSQTFKPNLQSEDTLLSQINTIKFKLKLQTGLNNDYKQEISHLKGIINIQNQHIKKLKRRDEEYFTKFDNVDSSLRMTNPVRDHLVTQNYSNADISEYNDYHKVDKVQFGQRIKKNRYMSPIHRSMDKIPNSSRQWTLFSPVAKDSGAQSTQNIESLDKHSTPSRRLGNIKRRQNCNFYINRKNVKNQILGEAESQRLMKKNAQDMVLKKIDQSKFRSNKSKKIILMSSRELSM